MRYKFLSGFIVIFLLFNHHLITNALIEDSSIKVSKIYGTDIYLDADQLNYTLVSFKSKNTLEGYDISSNCDISSRFFGKYHDRYIFKLDINNDCSNNIFYLKDPAGEIITNTKFELDIKSLPQTYEYWTDFPTEYLFRAVGNIDEDMFSLKNVLTTPRVEDNYLNLFEFARRYTQERHLRDILSEIIHKRSQKYIVPVEGYSLPDGSNASKFPNVPRPYRAGYTDGIHEGWDISSPFNSSIIALDDGIVVNVVRGFEFSDLNQIDKSSNLSGDSLATNLNHLRGNQVWIKTMKGDIRFYAHLDSVDDDIKVGNMVYKGQHLGLTGVSGIPEIGYNDHHLHIEIHKNPHNIINAGKYSLLDYMRWPWYFQGESISYILAHQYELFEK